MEILKSKIITMMTAFAFIFGLFFTVKAVQNDKDMPLQKATSQWFVYTGPPMSSTDPLNPYDPLNNENYSPYTGSGTRPSCSGEEQVCAVQLTADSSNPNHPDQEELNAISEEIENPTPITDVLEFKPAE